MMTHGPAASTSGCLTASSCIAGAAGGALPRILGGNTGSGLYKEIWPAEAVVLSVLRVEEMRGVTLYEVGASATVHQGVLGARA